MSVRPIDETEFGLGWMEDAREARASHALAVDGRVWLIDPIEPQDVEERLLALGEPAGVIQLLDRHNRDSKALATRLGVPLHVVPRELPGTPFQLLRIVRNRVWKEAALWWPEQRTLVCADALGTIPFFRSGDEVVGVHPLLRLRPPRVLLGLAPEHLLVGHGQGVHGPDTGTLVDDTVWNARRRLPRWLRGLPRIVRSG